MANPFKTKTLASVYDTMLALGELILVQVARLVFDPGCCGVASFSGQLLGLQWRFGIPFMQWRPGQSRARLAWQRWVHLFDGRLKLRRGG